MSFNLKQYQAIYEDIKAYIIANQDRITDFSDGSVIASEIEAFAREIALAYSETRAGYSEVLTKIPFSIFDFPKNEEQFSVGMERFSRIDTALAVPIPLGTQISTPSGVLYETTETRTIAAGSASVEAPIRAVEGGKSSNVPAGTINILVSGLTGVDTVTNLASVGGGVDAETSSEHLSRFRAYLLGVARSNRWGVISGALLNPALRSASLVEHFPPKDGLYNATLYLDDGSGTVSSGIIAAVKTDIDGDGTDVSPGYRAAGINFDYLAPNTVLVNVAGSVVVSYAVELSEAISTINNAVENHLNSKLIGQDVIRAQIQKVILDFPWVLDLDITGPASNITIQEGQIARVNTISLTFSQTTGE